MQEGSAFGAFTVQADLKSNTFSTTNPSLEVSTDNLTFGTQITPGFTETGIIPGGTVTDHTFYLKNSDTDTTGDLAVTGQFTVTSGSGSYLDDLNIHIHCNNGGDATASVTTWSTTPQNLGTLTHGTTATCTMSASLPGSNTTDANQSVTFDAVFNGSTL